MRTQAVDQARELATEKRAKEEEIARRREEIKKRQKEMEEEELKSNAEESMPVQSTTQKCDAMTAPSDVMMCMLCLPAASLASTSSRIFLVSTSLQRPL